MKTVFPLVVLGVLLSACVQPKQQPLSSTESIVEESQSEDQNAVVEEPVETVSDVEEKPEVAALPPIEVDRNPDQFLGAGLMQINEKIGAPVFARRDGTIEVWQYRRDWESGTCHLDLFLYPDSQSNLKVKLADLRSQFLSKEDQVNCFAEMLRDHIRKTQAPAS